LENVCQQSEMMMLCRSRAVNVTAVNTWSMLSEVRNECNRYVSFGL